jgi:hypothetical protein
MPQPLDYGEVTPTRFVDGGSKLWPVSQAFQYQEVKASLRKSLEATEAEPQAGLEVLVKWNGGQKTRVRIFRKDFGDGVLRECFEERDPATNKQVKRSYADLEQHVKQLLAVNSIKTYDAPPKAPGGDN